MTLTGAWAPETRAPRRAGIGRAEEAVLDALDVPALHRTVADLVRVPSVTGSDAESELLAGLADRTAAAGMDVDHWRLDVEELAGRPGFPGTEVRGASRGAWWPRPATTRDPRWCSRATWTSSRPVTCDGGPATRGHRGWPAGDCTGAAPAT